MISEYPSFLPFDTLEEAESRNLEMGSAFGLPQGSQSVTIGIFPIIPCPWDESKFTMIVRKGYLDCLNDSEKSRLVPYVMNSSYPTPIFCRIPINKSQFIDFDDILELPENIQTIDENMIVSYFRDQPAFVYDITGDDMGLTEYTYEEIFGNGDSQA